ncbi:hypothetical protein K488DRAFT_84721 [Vararia minispora EC-137]|uniref:Uncharacterized protein n=1 Tax=Vararia minispora EC-137 TaxID=1314806 RepID=A0ACB8QPR3_9AGAM|nr:hypothetical protein K488DRAFT_84721 [Vararia minispora EC-137]
MLFASDKVASLVIWCLNNGITIDPRLQIVADASGGGIRVCAKKGQSFRAEESWTASRWYGYLVSLPSEAEWDGIGLFWLAEGNHRVSYEKMTMNENVEDIRAAARWLRGTRVEEYAAEDEGGPLLETLRVFFDDVLQPLFARRWPQPARSDGTQAMPSWSWSGFCHAYALVSARAFIVDVFHQIAMVPIADAFNHANENHVHLETEWEVCPECGSHKECTHDAGSSGSERESPDEDRAGDSSADARRRRKRRRIEDPPDEAAADPENTCEMVANAPLGATDEAREVFNTYGRLSDAELVVRYGFALGDADAVDVPLSVRDVLACLALDGGADEAETAWLRALAAWLAADAHTWDASSRVSYVESDTAATATAAATPPLGVAPDGSVSHTLWALCAVCALPDLRLGRGSGGTDADADAGAQGEDFSVLRALARRQVQCERRLDAETACAGGPDGGEEERRLDEEGLDPRTLDWMLAEVRRLSPHQKSRPTFRGRSAPF